MNAQSRRVLLLENECSIQIGKMSALECFLKGYKCWAGTGAKTCFATIEVCELARIARILRIVLAVLSSFCSQHYFS